MISKKFILNEAHGLHARPAMKIAEKCLRFESKITICKGCEKADGCSIMELLLLGAAEGAEVELFVCGKDELEAFGELKTFFDQGSGI
jgi:phosphotransferase system HPr (HPr) family protein